MRKYCMDCIKSEPIKEDDPMKQFPWVWCTHLKRYQNQRDTSECFTKKEEK